MSSKARFWGTALAAVLLVGFAVQPLERQLQRALFGDDAELRIGSLADSLGQGITVAALGGYRSLAANLVWLSLNDPWQRRDAEATLSKIQLAVNLDSRPRLFWLNGARIIANDMPVWQVGQENADALDATQAGRAITRRFAEKALDLLEGALQERGPDWAILTERALIKWRKLGDLSGATAELKTAIDLPGVPYHVSRVYAELLVTQGRPREALEFLREHYKTLPEGDPAALKPVVERRIQDLANQLADEDSQR